MPRAMANVTISFGLVSVPVKLYVAASDESIKFNLITPEGNRVKQQQVDAVTGDVVVWDELKKGYEFAKDQFVTFTPAELEALRLVGGKTIEIKEFVPADSVNFVQVEKAYYVGPDKGGDKGLALLSDAMKALDKVAIAQWMNKGREHLVVVRPYKHGLVMQVLFYGNEVRDYEEIEVAALPITDAERTLAVKLIEALSSDEFESDKYEDRYAKAVREAVDAKVAGREVSFVEEVAEKPQVNLFEALMKSLEKAPAKKQTKKTSKKK